ncbi:MAG: 30S ribosomal protein S6 [Rhodospirillaceae bacterium]|nr:30S ribosomal protein S6 [Rhodospirillaceae bacterium]
MPLYESVYIARPDISATQVETLTADMTKILEENGGKVTKDEYWGLKSLAYRIKKNRKGHYSLMNIDAPAAALTEMERNMRLHEDVLRYMSIRVDEHEEEPSVMMQSKSSRDDRDRDRGRGRDDDRPKPAAAAPAAAETPAAAPAATEESAPAADNKETEV